MSKNEILNIINNFPIKDRIELIESVLKALRNQSDLSISVTENKSTGKDLLKFAGIWDKKMAGEFIESTKDCRKVDLSEW